MRRKNVTKIPKKYRSSKHYRHEVQRRDSVVTTVERRRPHPTDYTLPHESWAASCYASSRWRGCSSQYIWMQRIASNSVYANEGEDPIPVLQLEWFPARRVVDRGTAWRWCSVAILTVSLSSPVTVLCKAAVSGIIISQYSFDNINIIQVVLTRHI